MRSKLLALMGTGAVCESGTGVPPVNHAQDARAPIKLHQYRIDGLFWIGFVLSFFDWRRPIHEITRTKSWWLRVFRGPWRATCQAFGLAHLM